LAFSGTSKVNRVVRSTGVPSAEALAWPTTKSPSQCPGNRTIRYLRWPLVDADQVLDGLRAEPHLARTTNPMPAAESADHLPLECAPGQHIEIGIDGFMRDAHRRLVRIPLRQPACNLFGRPALREQCEDRRAQAGLDRQLPRLARVMGPGLHPLVSTHPPIRQGRGVLTSEIARHGTQGSTQRLSDDPETRPSGHYATQLLAFHEVYSSTLDHVQLPGSWFDQDTGVALES
jgi:hypothetical protein